MRERFDEFAERFAERASAWAERAGERAGRPAAVPALEEGYWQSVRALFTHGVTGRSFQDLQRDAWDSLRYFARDVDDDALRRRPWHKRYPQLAWRLFEATAYRLSPARRVLFVAGTALFALAWAAWLVSERRHGLGYDALLLAGLLLLMLLVLELRDKLALKGDLEVARQIQFGLLPFEPYEKDGVSIRAAMRPANTVGGDYFDVVALDGGQLAIVMGDVAGKGMPAALLMALLQGSLRTLITAGLRGRELIEKLNTHLCVHIPANRLVTLFYAELDLGPGALRYVNAGHNPPFVLRRDGAIERLAATGLALGIVTDAGFEVMETPLAPGDRLLLYTDGITEAFNPRDVEYGEERLEAYLRDRRGLGHAELLAGVIDDVLAFCGSARPADDMTLLVLGREG